VIFEQVNSGGDRNFAYIVADEESRSGFVVDPSFDCELLVARLRVLGVRVKYVINTHSHADHIAGNAVVKRETGALVAAHGSSNAAHDVKVEDGTELETGRLRAGIIHTPGHTLDSVCVLVGEKLLTGDTLFVGKVGGTDFGEGARREYESLHGKLMPLPDSTEVWPGHDYGIRPHSTIGEEKLTNPFLLRANLADFIELKRNWPEYKRLHGIK
jgi:glyoxylase-like metal-dependent hydrolase (beta-lactamase superfamily II)